MAKGQLYIPVILGSSRQNRRSEPVGNLMFNKVSERGAETELLDIRNLSLPFVEASGGDYSTPLAKDISQKLKRADGFVVISPEYNHSYPGVLKNFLDHFYAEYEKKPIGICGVSAGPLGGARMVEQLRLVVIELKAVPIREAIYFRQIDRLFDVRGELLDKTLLPLIDNFLNELIWYANVLKAGREKSADS